MPPSIVPSITFFLTPLQLQSVELVSWFVGCFFLYFTPPSPPSSDLTEQCLACLFVCCFGLLGPSLHLADHKVPSLLFLLLHLPTHHQCLASIKPRPLPIIHLHTHIYVVGTLWLFLVWCFISGPFGGNTARNCRGQSKTFPLCVESLILVCLPRFYPRFPLQKKSVGTGGGQNGKSYKRQNSSRAIPPTEQHIPF